VHSACILLLVIKVLFYSKVERFVFHISLTPYGADTQTGTLWEDCLITTFSEKKRFSFFFCKRTNKIQGSTMQRLKTLNLPDISGNSPQIYECCWSFCKTKTINRQKNNKKILTWKNCDWTFVYQVSRLEWPHRNSTCMLWKFVFSSTLEVKRTLTDSLWLLGTKFCIRK